MSLSQMGALPWKVILAGMLVTAALSGCQTSTPPPSALGEWKAPAQLLRNEVAGRIPADAVRELPDSVDASANCGDGGLKRYWRSKQLIFINPESAGRVAEIFESTVASLRDQGWEGDATDPSPTEHEVKLVKDKVDLIIDLKATEADDDGMRGAFELAVTGPCVMTDGPESDEVKRLEGRN